MKRRSSMGPMLMAAAVFAMASSSLWASQKVVIFDFEDRANEKLPQAKLIEQKLKEFDSTLQITQATAKSDEKQAVKMITSIDKQKPDLLITISSDAMRIANPLVKNTPYLFTNVTNPEFFGITDFNKPGQGRSGATYYVPVEKQLAFIQSVLPKAEKIGIIFEEAAQSRQVEWQEVQDYCAKHKLEVAMQLVKSKDDLTHATTKLLDEGVKAVIMTSSELFYDNGNVIAEVTSTKKVPLFTLSPKGMQSGAIAALVNDYGRVNENVLIPMAQKVLKDKVNPGAMPIGSLDNPVVALNLEAAKAIGFEFPEDVLKKAQEK